MPAMPMAGSRAAMVVGARQTNRATSTVSDHRLPLSGGLDAVDGERADVGADQQEDQGQGDQQHLQGDLVGGLAPLGPFDQGDHPVQEGLARIGGDPDDDAVGDDRGAAGDGAAVAAGFPHHRGRLAGHRRFVHQGRAHNDIAVTGDHVIGLHQDDVALAQLVGRKPAHSRRPNSGFFNFLAITSVRVLRMDCGPGLAAAFRHGLGKGGEDHGQPEPEGDQAGEPGRVTRWPLSRA